MSENKRLTPTVIMYVDGERLSTAWEGAFRSLNYIDPLNDIGRTNINFVFADPNGIDTDTFAYGSAISILIGLQR